MKDLIVRRQPIIGAISTLSSDFDRFLNSFFEDDFFRDGLSMSKSVSRLPKINVVETEEKYIIEAAVPGIDKKDIEIIMTGDNGISIQYSKQDEKEDKGQNYLIKELSGRSFQRIIPFYHKVNKDNIKAKIENGILKVEVNKIINKIEAYKDKVIKIEG